MAVKMMVPKKVTTMQLLTPEQKQFIVKARARYVTPPDIVKQVKEEFDIDIAVNVVYRYDPEKTMGSTLSAELRDLFNSTRRAFSDELEQIPGMVRAVRIQRLDDLYYAAMKKNDLKSAVAALTALRREMENFEFEGGEEGDPWPAA